MREKETRRNRKNIEANTNEIKKDPEIKKETKSNKKKKHK